VYDQLGIDSVCGHLDGDEGLREQAEFACSLGFAQIGDA
jgi:hypothetical protein